MTIKSALWALMPRPPQILEYIKTRDKVATFSLPWVIEANGFPYSEPGTPIVLCDYVGTPHLIVQLTDVCETTFGDIGYAESSLDCLLYTSPSPRDRTRSRMPSSA